MKRAIAFLTVAVAFVCCMGLAACGGTSASSGEGASSEASSASASEETSDSSEAKSTDAQESQVKALLGTIDPKSGVHMAYEEANESMGSVASIDAQAKGTSYYSTKTMTVQGITDTTITVMIDGVAMNLDADAKTGRVATTTTSQVAKSPMLMDDVYKALWTCAKLSPTSTEEGEMGGKTYTVVTYEQEYTADDIFYFDADGKLAYYVQGPIESGSTKIGETVYKITAIDATVDESLFDVSGYAIEGK